MLKSLLGQNNIPRIAKCGQGVLKRFEDFEYGGFYSKVNTEILHSSTAAERLCEFRENRSCTF